MTGRERPLSTPEMVDMSISEWRWEETTEKERARLYGSNVYKCGNGRN